jgi:uncharacterized membrane protein YkgB
MACSVSCSISAVFIIGMIYFNSSSCKGKTALEYKSKLPSNLKSLYDKIVAERQSISYYGYALGFLLSLVIIFYNRNVKNNRLGNTSLVCTVVATSFLTNYFYYILTPKSDWMLNHITKPEDARAWLQMYRTCSYNYHLGLLLGIMGVGMFAFAFR